MSRPPQSLPAAVPGASEPGARVLPAPRPHSTYLTYLTHLTRLTCLSRSTLLRSHARFRRLLPPLLLALPSVVLADSTNTLRLRADLPDAGLSAVRALAALAIVLAVFFGGVWLYRNGQRLAWRKSGPPKLAILESRPLGNRYALHVVGYEQQRLLIGSSPAGLSLLSQLPAATEAPQAAPAAPPEPVPFVQYLQRLLRGQPDSKPGGAR